MALAAQVNSYISNHYDGMSPEQLILMLFKGALERLKLAKEGIAEEDIRKRGENLGKAIAIISELNSSLDPKMDDEGTQFLRGLYHSILTELPRVSITNDPQIIETTERYISKLKEIWESDVLGKARAAGGPRPERKAAVRPLSGYPQQPPRPSVPQRGVAPTNAVRGGGGGYPPAGRRSALGSISA